MTEKLLPELKECPFCGGIPEILKEHGGFVIAHKCIINFNTWFGSPEVAAQRWNTRATASPVSKEVDEAINAVRLYIDETFVSESPDHPHVIEQYLQTLITAAKTATPPRMKSSADINPEDFNKPGSVVFTPDAPGFTREELVNTLAPLIQDNVLSTNTEANDVAAVVLKALIDMGAVKVARPLQGGEIMEREK